MCLSRRPVVSFAPPAHRRKTDGLAAPRRQALLLPLIMRAAASKKWHWHVSCFLCHVSVSNAWQVKEERRMKRSSALSWTIGILVGLGVSLITWVIPAPA